MITQLWFCNNLTAKLQFSYDLAMIYQRAEPEISNQDQLTI